MTDETLEQLLNIMMLHSKFSRNNVIYDIGSIVSLAYDYIIVLGCRIPLHITKDCNDITNVEIWFDKISDSVKEDLKKRLEGVEKRYGIKTK